HISCPIQTRDSLQQRNRLCRSSRLEVSETQQLNRLEILRILINSAFEIWDRRQRITFFVICSAQFMSKAGRVTLLLFQLFENCQSFFSFTCLRKLPGLIYLRSNIVLSI